MKLRETFLIFVVGASVLVLDSVETNRTDASTVAGGLGSRQGMEGETNRRREMLEILSAKWELERLERSEDPEELADVVYCLRQLRARTAVQTVTTLREQWATRFHDLHASVLEDQVRLFLRDSTGW